MTIIFREETKTCLCKISRQGRGNNNTSMAFFNILFLFFLIRFLNFATIEAGCSTPGCYDIVEDPYNRPLTTPPPTSPVVVTTTTITTTTYVDKNCSLATPATANAKSPAINSAFQWNKITLLSILVSSNQSNTGFFNTTVSSSGDKPSELAYGLFMCRGDVPPEPCQLCVQNAAEQLRTDCTLSEQALIWYDDCMVRYSNYYFFSTADTDPMSFHTTTANISNPESFMQLLLLTINKTADEAARSANSLKKFATRQANVSGLQRLYCLAQCTPDLSPHDCKTCLHEAIGDLPSYSQGKQGGRVLYPSCNIRYELFPFYRSTAPSTIPVPASNFSNADSRFTEDPTYLYHNCSTTDSSSADSAFKTSIKNLLLYMSSNATNGRKSYYKGSVDDTVYGLFMCRGDLPSRLCQQCVLNATNRVSSECHSFKEAIIWYSHCMLRYSTGNFSPEVGKIPTFQVLNVTNSNSSTIPGQDYFTFALSNTLANLAEVTGDTITKGYATKSLKLNDQQTLYTLGQCTQDLSSDDCKSCLQDINGKIPWSNLGSVGGRVLYPSCNLRFELFQFYGNLDKAQPPTSANPSPSAFNKENRKSRSQILIIVLPIISVTILCFGYYMIKRKARKSVKTILRENFGQESAALEPLQFHLATIEAATNNFSNENRIGKGGFGEVYKGILVDGRQIAVKRLSKCSKQGENEFKNEVLSIAKLQHKNLVAFIGFCLEEQEKILIYEYVPNKSLDYFLFDSQRSKLLSWSERYNIIVGIAQGILYLHEHSRLKVIHRDLKPSNVLLDENMIPKISDFGLARIVEINQEQGSTNRIVGTYGYMSPEYAMRGQFSEKSDVFSFGVMILEIISGKKNSSSHEPNYVADDLASYVWRRWRDQTPVSILDTSIKENYSETEVIRCIQIGLLSIQLNPNARPTMEEIVSYLSSYLIDLPSPQEPPFLLHGRMDSQAHESSSSQSINNSTSVSINEMSISEFLPR